MFHVLPTINRILPLIKYEAAPVPIEMHLRRAHDGSHTDNTPTTFHYVIMGEIWMVLWKKHATQ